MKYLTTNPLRLIAAGVFLSLLLTYSSRATNLFLDVNGATTNSGVANAGTYSWESSIWSTSAVGTNATTTWSEGNFPEFATGNDATGSYTVTAGSPHHIVGALQRISAGTVTVAGADLTIDSTGGVSPGSGGAGGSGPQQGFFSSGNLTITAKLTGSGGIQSQSGQISLNNAANDYSGGTTINPGLINFNSASSFGSGVLTLGANGTALIAEASGITIPNNFSNSLTSGNGLNLSATGHPFTTTYSGDWNLVANNLPLGAGGGTDNTVILSGVISNTGGFGRQSSTTHGTIKLTGANTYTGKTLLQSSVTSVSSINSVTTPAQQPSSNLGRPSNAANGTLGIGATTFTGTLVYTGVGETSDRVIDLAGTTGGAIIQNDGTGPITFASANTASGAGIKTLTLQGANTGANTIAGAIVDNSAVNTTALTKAGAGKWVLTGANTYSGNTTVSAGTLIQGAAGVIPFGAGKGTFAVSSGATFDMGGLDCSVNGFGTSAGTIDNTTGSGSYTLTIGNNNGAGTHSGPIKNSTGTVSVTKTGSGAIVLSGSSTYSGKTIVNGGTLTINTSGDACLGAAPASPVADQLTLNNGVTFGLGTAANTTISANRGIQLSGSVTITMSSKTLTVPGIISGTGSLTKAGSTDLLLNGANTYSGGTTVTGGGLTLNNNLAIGTGGLTVTPGGVCTITGKSGTTVLTNNITVNVGGGQVIDFFATSGNNLTLNGQISGSAAIFRGNGGGAGNLTLNGNNSTYSGTLTLQQGPLVLGHKNALGTGTFVVTPGAVAISLSANTALTGANAVANATTLNGTLPVTGAPDLELSGIISGASGAISKSGSGKLILSSANTYGSGTTVTAGTLLANNSSGSATGAGALTVQTNATLGGGGDIAGTVTVNNGGTIAPGNSIGTLTLDVPPVLNGTNKMEIDRNAGSPLADKLVVSSGTLTYGGTLNIVNLGAPLQANDTFTLFNAGTYGSSFSSIIPATPGAGLVWDTSGLTVNGTIKAICNGTLAASAGANTNICTGSGALIGGSPTATGGSGTGYTYSWSPATGLNDATLANPTATPASTTTYTVTVTDSVGCTAMASVTVGVDVAPAITGQPANTTVCSGSSASFSVAATGSGLNYSWSKHSNSGWGSAWTIGASGGGTFLASSTGNNSGDPNCNGFNAGGDINTSGGNSFGLYGGSGGESVSRDFPSALTSGQSFSIDMDNGNVDVGQQNGFALQTSGGTFLLSFYFLGGSNYKFYDTSEHDTGIAFTRTGLRIQLIVNSASTYKLVVTPCGGSASVFFGTFANAGDAGKLVLFNNNGSGGGANDLFFNNIIAGGAVDNADNYSSGYVGQDMGDQAIVAGNGSSTYTTPALITGDSGTQYAVVVSGCSGTVLSSAATVTVNPPATVSAGPNQTVCASSPAVALAGSFGGAASSGTWSGGTGSFNPNNTTTNATYTPTAGEITAGTVTLTLTTDDPSGPCGPVNSSMTITINPAATVSAGPNQTVCASSPAVTLAGSFGGAASTATWSGGAGSFNPNNTTTNAIYTPTAGEITAGTVTLTLTTDDPTGLCGPVTASMTITNNPAATVNAGPNQTVCGDNPATILAGAIGGGASSATWSGGAGSFSPNNTTTNATYTPTAGEITAGSVTLTLTTDDPAGPCGAVNASIVITFDKVTATNVTFVRNAGVSLKISKTNLVANASDTDSETISVVGAGTDGVNLLTTNGATLSMDADWIYYTNSVTPDVNDSFLYKVTDSRGCVGVATVFVQVVQNETGQGTTVTVSNGVATVGFAGIPGRSYQVQRSTNLTDWVTLVTTNAPANGVFEWADDFNDLGVPPADPPSSAYYRLRVP